MMLFHKNRRIHVYQTIIKFLIMLTIVIMSGCASFTSQTFNPNISWKTRSRQLKQINHWQIQGAIKAQTTKKHFSAYLAWHQKNRAHYVISLFGPLGIDAAKITKQHGLFTLQTAKNQIFTAKTPEQLAYQQLGLRLPVSNLYYWVRGLPVPRKQATLRWDRYHHLKAITQEHWHIQYIEYQVVNRVDLPKEILLNNKQISLQIIIHRWKIDQGS